MEIVLTCVGVGMGSNISRNGTISNSFCYSYKIYKVFWTTLTPNLYSNASQNSIVFGSHQLTMHLAFTSKSWFSWVMVTCEPCFQHSNTLY